MKEDGQKLLLLRLIMCSLPGEESKKERKKTGCPPAERPQSRSSCGGGLFSPRELDDGNKKNQRGGWRARMRAPFFGASWCDQGGGQEREEETESTNSVFFVAAQKQEGHTDKKRTGGKNAPRSRLCFFPAFPPRKRERRGA
jgi:hypothetical protein